MLMVSATLLTALRPISRALPPIMSSTSLPPIVILPGFGNADVDYKTPFNQPEDKGFVAVLARRGFDDVSIVELPRWEWIRVAGGLFDIDFWFNKQRPESRAYGWYMERARRTILAASKRAGRAAGCLLCVFCYYALFLFFFRNHACGILDLLEITGPRAS